MIRNIGGGDVLEASYDTETHAITKKREYTYAINYERLEKHIICNTKFKNKSCRGYSPEILELFVIKPIMTEYGDDVDFLD